jgi:hypothetical protein
MDNTVLIDAYGLTTCGLVLYGYRTTNQSDQRIRLVTAERPLGAHEVVVTRILEDSEDFDGESGMFDTIEIDSSSAIHDQLDDESNSGWLEGGRLYSTKGQEVVTLTANELLGISGSLFVVKDIDRTIAF